MFGCGNGVLPIPIHFQAFFVAVIFFFGEFGDFGSFEQFGEDAFLKCRGFFHEPRQIAQDEEPFVEHTVQLAFLLVELRHLEVDECQLVVEYFLSLPICQLYLVVVVRVMLVVESEVEDTYDVDRFELVVPSPFLPLFLYGERGIV